MAEFHNSIPRFDGRSTASNKRVVFPSHENDTPLKKARRQELPAFYAPLEEVYAKENFAYKNNDDTLSDNHRRKPAGGTEHDDKMRRTNDEVHGSILYPSVVATLVDTTVFQRLRDLKQLGTADQAYINCVHTRFEHSLGVYWLSTQHCECLRKNQPCLRDPVFGLTEKDALCVGIAGLLHDIGHGPFSHTYERFLHKMPKHLREHPEENECYTGYPEIPKTWQHEDMSLQLVDAILRELGLAIDLDHLDLPLKRIIGDGIDPRSLRVHDDGQVLAEKEAVLTSRDWVFVKEAIYGKPVPGVCRHFGMAHHRGFFVGRPWECKAYLYDIVSNSFSGLDADKLDYLARDASKAMGNPVRPLNRVLEESLVARIDPEDSVRFRSIYRDPQSASTSGQHYTIAYPKKMTQSLLDDVFLKRRDLHKTIYKHHTVECANLMICDMLCYADPYLRLPLNCNDAGEDTKPEGKPPSRRDLPLSRAMLHENAYLRLRDVAVLSMISNDTNPGLRKARELVERYQRRDLYKMAAEQHLDCDQNEHDRILWEELSEGDIEEDILRLASTVFAYESTRLTKTDIKVDKAKMHCGSGTKNPITQIRFLETDAERQARRAKSMDELPLAKECDVVCYQDKLPRSFETRVVRLYVRDKSKRDLAQHAFIQWYDSCRQGHGATTLEPKQEPLIFSPVALTQDSIAEPNSTPRRFPDNNHRYFRKLFPDP